MDFLTNAWAAVGRVTPLLGVLVVVVAGLVFTRRVLDRRYGGAVGARFRIPLIMAGLTLVGVVAIVMVLPVSETLRAQLLSLIGVLLSASIALSATTLVGNAMAGVLLRVVGGFKTGDFIQVGDNAGRVSERGLFHTEIQTAERQLVTLPNLHLVNNPVTVIAGDGTLISAHLSLGYDVPRAQVERLLIQGIEAAGLTDPFVQVTALGDFSISYRAAGLLADVSGYLSAQSRLRGAVLDALHNGGVEIVSPSFMNTRAFAPDARFMPPASAPAAAPATTDADAVAFAKAEAAANIDGRRAALAHRLTELRVRRDAATTDEVRAELDVSIAAAEAEQAQLADVTELASGAADSDP